MNIRPRTFWFLVSILVVLILNLGSTGAYVYNPGNRVFWIDPSTTTLPYIVLLTITLRTLSQNEKYKMSTIQPICAYIGALTSMIIFTFWLIFLEHGPRNSSTMAIAIIFTPMFFAAAAIPGYMIGWTIGNLIKGSKEC